MKRKIQKVTMQNPDTCNNSSTMSLALETSHIPYSKSRARLLILFVVLNVSKRKQFDSFKVELT